MPDLVAPIVPNAQENKSPEIFLQAMNTGLAAAARFADQRRQTESDIAKLALAERVQMESADIDRRKLEMAAELLPYQKARYNAESGLFAAREKAYNEGRGTVAQRNLAWNEQMQNVIDGFNTSAQERDLLNPEKAVKDPVGFAEGVINQREEWQYGRIFPPIKNALTELQRVADQHKVPFGVDKTEVPIIQIVEKLRSGDETIRAETIKGLKAAGHFKRTVTPGTPTQEWSRPFDTMWDAVIGPAEIVTQEPTELTKKMIEPGKFQHVPSKVPPSMLPRTYGPGTSGPTAMPETEEEARDMGTEELETEARVTPPRFDPTETDLLLQGALLAIQRGANPKAVAARLRENRVDPNLLRDYASRYA